MIKTSIIGFILRYKMQISMNLFHNDSNNLFQFFRIAIEKVKEFKFLIKII